MSARALVTGRGRSVGPAPYKSLSPKDASSYRPRILQGYSIPIFTA